jgi:hypothetical protein
MRWWECERMRREGEKGAARMISSLHFTSLHLTFTFTFTFTSKPLNYDYVGSAAAII